MDMTEKPKNYSRRDFLKTTGIATGALIGGGLIGGLVGLNANKTDQNVADTGTTHHEMATNQGFQFFQTQREFDVLSNATERILPKDDLGPGAIDLGVAYFIDRQLAAQYGSNTKEYMHGPFAVGAKTQGYQSRLTRASIFRQGIAKLEDEANNRFDKGFSDLEAEQMDEILTAFQNDEIAMTGVTSAFFFRLLRTATLEGAYADPMYGGNRNMEGWKMKEFPSLGHSKPVVRVKDKFQKIEPKSLGGM